jgi:HPt (histidine-containing phosphotransfer) domain-containing protein
MFGEMSRAAADRDIEGMRRIAHTLKGCVANVGARPVVEAILSVEGATKAGDLDRGIALAATAVSRGATLVAALENACRV